MHSNMVSIRQVTISDLKTLQSISRQTFSEAFSGSNTEADMRQYLEENLSLEQLQSELQDPNAAFYFAEQEGQAAAYLKVNSGTAQTEVRDQNALEIERIYVLRQYYGTGIGQQLLEHALQLARQRQAHYVWLGVWEANYRAIRFYEKNGFERFGTHIFMLGRDAQTDVLMKRLL